MCQQDFGEGNSLSVFENILSAVFYFRLGESSDSRCSFRARLRRSFDMQGEPWLAQRVLARVLTYGKFYDYVHDIHILYNRLVRKGRGGDRTSLT